MAMVVGTAANGTDAVAFADEPGPDLILMNALFSGMDIRDACRNVKAHTLGMAIILYTPHFPDIYVCRPCFCADACMAWNALSEQFPLAIGKLISEYFQTKQRRIDNGT